MYLHAPVSFEETQDEGVYKETLCQSCDQQLARALRLQPAPVLVSVRGVRTIIFIV